MSKKEKKRRVIDFSTYKFRHIAIKFAYFGWDYSGLAIQKDTINTVSEKLLIGLEKTQMIENRETCGLVCCGRTDKGVSAAGQVISLNVRSLLEKGIGFVEGSGVNITSRKEIPNQEMDYVFLLNKVLPQDIRVLAWAAVPTDFSARFQCIWREYKYIFPRGALDIQINTPVRFIEYRPEMLHANVTQIETYKRTVK